MTDEETRQLTLRWMCHEHDYEYVGPTKYFDGCPRCPGPPRGIFINRYGRIITTGFSKEEVELLEAASGDYP